MVTNSNPSPSLRFVKEGQQWLETVLKQEKGSGSTSTLIISDWEQEEKANKSKQVATSRASHLLNRAVLKQHSTKLIDEH
eukprot:955419-Amphidinium_carterae.1